MILIHLTRLIYIKSKSFYIIKLYSRLTKTDVNNPLYLFYKRQANTHIFKVQALMALHDHSPTVQNKRKKERNDPFN